MTANILLDFTAFSIERREQLYITLWEHVQMSLTALLIAVFIAVPAGILLNHYQKGAEPVIGTTAVLQTIPSLALLGFLIPFIGIGTAPAIVALTAYALMPVLRNTYTGIREVDPALMEASRSMGMDSRQQLLKVQLPLAMPMMMAGIRTSMVLIVGTATLAALIGAGGLGDLIMLGINRADNFYILLGAIPAALLALFFDAVLRFAEKRSLGTSLKPMVAVVVIALLVVVSPRLYQALPFADEEADIVLAGKIGAEPEIILNMYQELIESDTDYSVDIEPGFGTTDFTFEAALAGEVDGYLEFTGTAIADFLNEDPVSNDEQEAYEQAREGMKEEYGLEFLEPMDYQNTYALAITEEIAEEEDLNAISDLRGIASELTAGFTFEFIDRNDGYPAIQDVYGIEFGDVEGMDPGLRSEALVSEDVQVIDAYSTDAYMIRYDLLALEDDENVFPPFNGAPLLRQEVLQDYPQIEDSLNRLGGMITEEEMMEMNYRVDEEDEDAAEVAEEFLIAEGLIDG
ncbi:ABC transporter permease/substrate-binding protein [Salisediminibacterium halotolerans]|uniref:ABC transporter permease/substrate-binding protein n=1 Tax=Salisediminibacterium halotolerans TaxID=517425 RepID=UPI000EAC7B8A|nr:ABC transporter permease/substrate-binding protein [Salisediminibacterium halotolerans]RLJ74072.1 osmoprotectant transport system permease protein [Actinophytocola xinjiangensis]RPE87835.1 osmoprotectant transport system permease protein [Salisediminibacterium halotolerans]TWG34909.1 osmoprotectant transport system permease protein [Salisediminibacterium halotolerans]GEL07904.1 ABC transporter permease [Salisediminibacterium halotolerans]